MAKMKEELNREMDVRIKDLQDRRNKEHNVIIFALKEKNRCQRSD